MIRRIAFAFDVRSQSNAILVVALLVCVLLTSVCPAADFWKKNTQISRYGGIRVIAADQDGMIYVAGRYDQFDTWNTIQRSTDRGATWISSQTYVPGRTIYAMSASQQGVAFACVSVGDSLLYWSTDYGAVWYLFPTSGITDTGRAVLQCQHGFVFLHTNHALYRSSDSGKNWVTCLTNLRTNAYAGLFEDSSGAITEIGEDSIHRTTDDGATWRSLPPIPFACTIQCATTHTDGSLYCGTTRGLFCTNDRGVTWKRIASVIRDTSARETLADSSVTAVVVNSSGAVFVAVASRRIYMLHDSAYQWKRLPLMDSLAVVSTLLNTADDYLYAGTTFGMYRSQERSTFNPVGPVYFPLHAGDKWQYTSPFTHNVTSCDVIADTLMANGRWYVKSMQRGFLNRPMYLRNDDSGRTWRYRESGDSSGSAEELLVYDFSRTKGEAFISNFGPTNRNANKDSVVDEGVAFLGLTKDSRAYKTLHVYPAWSDSSGAEQQTFYEGIGLVEEIGEGDGVSINYAHINDSTFGLRVSVELTPSGTLEYSPILWIYPTLAHDAVRIRCTQGALHEIVLSNLLGIRRWIPSTSSDSHIEIDDLPNGVYFVQGRTALGSLVSARFFVQR